MSKSDIKSQILAFSKPRHYSILKDTYWSFLWTYAFLGLKLTNYVSPDLKIYDRYCHDCRSINKLHLQSLIIKTLSNRFQSDFLWRPYKLWLAICLSCWIQSWRLNANGLWYFDGWHFGTNQGGNYGIYVERPKTSDLCQNI